MKANQTEPTTMAPKIARERVAAGAGPLPAGHPLSWSLLTTGTCLAGVVYPAPAHLVREWAAAGKPHHGARKAPRRAVQETTVKASPAVSKIVAPPPYQGSPKTPRARNVMAASTMPRGAVPVPSRAGAADAVVRW